MERATVGAVEVIAVVDGAATYPGGSVFPQAGDDLQRYGAYLDADGGLEMPFCCFVLRDGETTVLVDAGMGPEHEGGFLADLAAAGVTPEEVDFVIFTHLHGDHTGWNIDRQSGRPVFPNARYLVSKADWDEQRAQAEPAASFTRDIAPLEALGCLDLIEPEHAVTTTLSAVPTPGHTPGHLGVAIASGGEQGFILGDALLSRIDVEQPDWPNAWDADGTTAQQTRRALLERLEAQSALVGASHLPAPGLGHVVRAEGGYTWRQLARGG